MANIARIAHTTSSDLQLHGSSLCRVCSAPVASVLHSECRRNTVRSSCGARGCYNLGMHILHCVHQLQQRP